MWEFGTVKTMPLGDRAVTEIKSLQTLQNQLTKIQVHLSERGMTCYTVTWQYYYREEQSIASSKFDCSIKYTPSTPCRSFLRDNRRVPEQENEDLVTKVVDFASFCKAVLKWNEIWLFLCSVWVQRFCQPRIFIYPISLLVHVEVGDFLQASDNQNI